jgi:hypothetical protein
MVTTLLFYAGWHVTLGYLILCRLLEFQVVGIGICCQIRLKFQLSGKEMLGKVRLGLV